MPTFQRAPQAVEDMAAAVLAKHESHAPLLNHAVKIDYIFAFADRRKSASVPDNQKTSGTTISKIHCLEKRNGRKREGWID